MSPSRTGPYVNNNRQTKFRIASSSRKKKKKREREREREREKGGVTHLDVADDAAAAVVEELNANLDTTTLGAGAAENLGHLNVCGRAKHEPNSNTNPNSEQNEYTAREPWRA